MIRILEVSVFLCVLCGESFRFLRDSVVGFAFSDHATTAITAISSCLCVPLCPLW